MLWRWSWCNSLSFSEAAKKWMGFPRRYQIQFQSRLYCSKSNLEYFVLAKGCVGGLRKYKQCFSPPCWSNWITFESCSASCGVSGVQNWTRRCLGKTSSFNLCSGKNSELRRCNTHVSSSCLCPLLNYERRSKTIDHSKAKAWSWRFTKKCPSDWTKNERENCICKV